MSLPLWERGLKYKYCRIFSRRQRVAPLVGAWIEILANYEHRPHLRVAPLVGAWIEIRGVVKITVVYNRRSPCGSVD